MSGNMRKMLISVLVGSLFAAMPGTALAQNVNSSNIHPQAGPQSFNKQPNRMNGQNQPNGRPSQGQQPALEARLSNDLKMLVKAGIIDQKTANTILAYVRKNRPAPNNNQERGDLFTNLASQGVITQEQCDAIHAKLQQVRGEQRKQQLAKALNILVRKGILTEDIASQVTSYLDQEAAKVAAMSEEERQQYLEENRAPGKGPINDLITQGVLTQEQAQALVKLLPKPEPPRGPRPEQQQVTDTVYESEEIPSYTDQNEEIGMQDDNQGMFPPSQDQGIDQNNVQGQFPPGQGNGIRPQNNGQGQLPPGHGNGIRPRNNGQGQLPSDQGNGIRPQNNGQGQLPPGQGNGIRPRNNGQGQLPPGQMQNRGPQAGFGGPRRPR